MFLNMTVPLSLPVLASARVHEAQGVGAIGFAVMQAAMRPGPLVWIAPERAEGRVMPSGLARFLDPERLVAVTARAPEDLLWAAEEALRAGAAGLVVVEPLRPLGLTEGRRLQLAAEAGSSTGLLLIRDGSGSPAAETRWAIQPLPEPAEPDSTRAAWSLIKNKAGTLGSWALNWNGASAAVHMVSEARERHEPAEPPR